MGRIDLSQALLNMAADTAEEKTNFYTIKVTKQSLVQFAETVLSLPAQEEITLNHFYAYCNYMGVTDLRKLLVLHTEDDAGVALCKLISKLTIPELRLVIFEGDIYGTKKSYFSTVTNSFFSSKPKNQKSGLRLPDYIPLVFIKTPQDTETSYAKTANLIEELKLNKSNDVYVIKSSDTDIMQTIYKKYKLTHDPRESKGIDNLANFQVSHSKYKLFWKYHIPINAYNLENGSISRVEFLTLARSIYNQASALDAMQAYFKIKQAPQRLDFEEKATDITSLPVRDYTEAFVDINKSNINDEILIILELYFFYFYADIRYVTNPVIRQNLNPLTVFDAHIIAPKKTPIQAMVQVSLLETPVYQEYVGPQTFEDICHFLKNYECSYLEAIIDFKTLLQKLLSISAKPISSSQACLLFEGINNIVGRQIIFDWNNYQKGIFCFKEPFIQIPQRYFNLLLSAAANNMNITDKRKYFAAFLNIISKQVYRDGQPRNKLFTSYYDYFLLVLLHNIAIDSEVESLIYKSLEAKEVILEADRKLLMLLPLERQQKLFTKILQKNKATVRLLHTAAVFLHALSVKNIKTIITLCRAEITRPKAKMLINDFNEINHCITLLCELRRLLKRNTKKHHAISHDVIKPNIWLDLFKEVHNILNDQLHYLFSNIKNLNTQYLCRSYSNSHFIPVINTQGIAIIFRYTVTDRKGIIEFYLQLKYNGSNNAAYALDENFFPRTIFSGLIDLLAVANANERSYILPHILKYIALDRPFPALSAWDNFLVKASLDKFLKVLSCPISMKSNASEIECILNHLRHFPFQTIIFSKLTNFLIIQAKLLSASIFFSSIENKQRISSYLLTMYEYVFDKSPSLLKHLNEDAFHVGLHVAESISVDDQIRWLTLLTDVRYWHRNKPIFERVYQTFYAALKNNYAQKELENLELPQHALDVVAEYCLLKR